MSFFLVGNQKKYNFVTIKNTIIHLKQFITMRRIYFLLIFLALLFVCNKSYAQMQGINTSSERSLFFFYFTVYNLLGLKIL